MSDMMYDCKHNQDGSIIVCYATARGCPLCTLEHDTHTQSTQMDAILENKFYAYEHGDENYPKAGSPLSWNEKYLQRNPKRKPRKR